MLTSQQTNEISAALAKAQNEIINPEKNSQNPHYKNDYADLVSGIKAIRGPLSKHGIAFIQSERLDGDILFVETRLSHSSGQWFQSEHPAIKFPARPQEIGSAITYARRYSLFAMVGIAGEDDDGEAANKVEIKSAPKPEPARYDKETSAELLSVMLEALTMAKTEKEIAQWTQDNMDKINLMQRDHKQQLSEAVTKAKAALTRKAA